MQWEMRKVWQRQLPAAGFDIGKGEDTVENTLQSYRESEGSSPCEFCKAPISHKVLAENYFRCPVCGRDQKIPARVRIELLADKGTFTELFADVTGGDPIGFPDYPQKLAAAREKSNEKEAVLTGSCKIGGERTALFVMESRFMMGSMGGAVGDKLAALFEYATLRQLPVIGYTVSGGARMQEGMLSLMQMAKVSGAVKQHSDGGNLYLVCATHPTTGGVTASFAMLGDVILAEPGALIGFAGKRVIEQVTGETLPASFQSAEFQLENGFLDAIVPREAQKEYLSKMLQFHKD